jgi:glycosyltransferase involved in cell wall biosynthesis
VYRAADCVLFTSLDLETFGFVALESFTQGVPVIGSNAGAIPEMLSKADPNLIVKPPNRNGLTQKIKWFMNLKPAERSILAEKCLVASDQYNSNKNKDVLYQAMRDVNRE